jgi:ActR/RegA family two-component response regulator
MTHLLAGKRVLIVEDDDILAITLAEELAAQGVKVIGPSATVVDAVDVIATTDLDAAIVDINLRGKAAFPVADALADRHIAFVFATGYLVAGHIPARHANVRRFEKPIPPNIICRAIEEAVHEASDRGANKRSDPKAAP